MSSSKCAFSEVIICFLWLYANSICMLILSSVISYSFCFVSLLSSYHIIPFSFNQGLNSYEYQLCFWIFFLIYLFLGSLQILHCNIGNWIHYFVKGFQATLVGPYHHIVSKPNGHIDEALAAFLIIFEPCDIPGWWPGRLGQHGGVMELEGPGQLGQQGIAVERHVWWPGRLDQQGRNFNWHPWF